MTRLTIILLPTLLGACLGVEESAPTWEEFRERVFQEPESGLYIVDGDIPVESEVELRDFYERHLPEWRVREHGIGTKQSPLTINRAGGRDDSWGITQKKALRYCVSTTFGGSYQTVVRAMQRAAGDWEVEADVRLVHVQAEDRRCTASNGNVTFDVRPIAKAPYLARAFFPSFSRANRNILIARNAIGGAPPYSLVGILRHEIGHALGFRHEHTRPEGPSNCFEDSSWRGLTSYDSASVMHYPWCNGSNRGDLVLTVRDGEGARSVYGAASTGRFRSDNFSNHFIRHRNRLGELTTLSSSLDFADATFVVVPALAQGASSNCVSFQSENFPGQYLRHANGRIRLDAYQLSDLYRADATFCRRSGLAGRGISFESHNFPGNYIRHRNFHLYLERGSGSLFEADATFHQQ